MSDAHFVGRRREFKALRSHLERIERWGEGVAVAIRGRRQVGKSHLVERFCQESGLPYAVFQADQGVSPTQSMTRLLESVRNSDLPGAQNIARAVPDDWHETFRLLATAIPDDSPSILVIDELPWLFQRDQRLEGMLQTEWDRRLKKKPLFLILVGSDIHMMRAFLGYDRPFYGRAAEMQVRPLNPTETAALTGLAGPDAIDAHLITGGFPGLCRTWKQGSTAEEYVAEQCELPESPLFTVGAQMVSSEFPAPDRTRQVLAAIGHGSRTFSNIAKVAGASPTEPLSSGSLTPILHRLIEKGAVAADEPLSTRPGNGGKLFRIADSYLRLYHSVLVDAHADSRRGRPDLAYARFERQWTSWRGRAIEPLVREALVVAGIHEAFPWPEATEVGGWWPRSFDPEIDLVGADRRPVAKHLFYTGSIKWLGRPFDRRDYEKLVAGSSRVPGAVPGETDLAVVSLAGVADGVEADLVWGPDDLLQAWAA
ncbi:AAA family ATPase [Glycomyces arizonensis]|uniref:AAA family ATPase n=1 Tax=Glycomyces arizonensis TaxID=256035 RepID=UPI000425F95E|nr:ATP-binding protein [Glycomyces arizonensis]